MRKPLWIFALASMVALPACSTIQTTGLGESWKEGISYNLPKGVFRLSVIEVDGVLSVRLAGPVMVADPEFPLVSRLPRSGTSGNTVKVTVDPKTNLLIKADVTSTGDLGTIVTNVARAITLQSGSGTSGDPLFSRTYDISQLTTKAGADLNDFLVQYYTMKCGDIERTDLPFATILKDDEAVAADAKSLAADCRRMNLAGFARADTSALVRIAVLEGSTDPATNNWTRKRPIAPVPDGAQCATGLCYRPMKSVAITLEVKGVFMHGDVFLIPDEKRTLFVSLPQGVFAEQKYNLVFSDGVLTDYGQTTKSELVGLTALPVEVIKAILSAPGEALGLKTGNLKAKAEYLDQLAKLQVAKDNALSICTTDRNACPSTAQKIIGGDVIAKAVAAKKVAPEPKPGQGFSDSGKFVERE